MSEEELELLLTLDDPDVGPEVDNFHLEARNTLECWLGQRCQFERAEAASDSAAFKVTFGQGDWTCTLSSLSGTTPVAKRSNENVSEPSNKYFDIEVCTVTQRKHGQIVDRKVFYDLVGMQKQIGTI